MNTYNENSSETETRYNIEVIGPLYKKSQEVRDCLERLEAKVLPKLKETDRAKRAALSLAHTKMFD